MTTSDAEVFTARLVELGEVLDGKLTEGKMLLYFDALRDIPLDAVLVAMKEAAKTCRFFPKPVELRTLAVGDADDNAEMAWLEWKAAARRIGAYRPFASDDPALLETLVAVFGSWPQACWIELTPEMWAAKRKEFGRVYRVMCARGVEGTKQLSGQCDIDNQLRFGQSDIQAIALARDAEPPT